MDIGIRELKSRLSEIVDRAAAGETIRVTERGRPKAVLGPIPGTLDLRAAADQGWLTTGDGSDPVPERTRYAAGSTIAGTMKEDRGA